MYNILRTHFLYLYTNVCDYKTYVCQFCWFKLTRDTCASFINYVYKKKKQPKNIYVYSCRKYEELSFFFKVILTIYVFQEPVIINEHQFCRFVIDFSFYNATWCNTWLEHVNSFGLPSLSYCKNKNCILHFLLRGIYIYLH